VGGVCFVAVARFRGCKILIRAILGAKLLECVGCGVCVSSKGKAARLGGFSLLSTIVSDREVIHARRISPVLFALGDMGA
jgi:hypothetical protein